MKKRNGLLLLGALLASASLVACSSSMNTKGKGIAQLMNDNQERVFYRTDASSVDEPLPKKDGYIHQIYITKGGKLKSYSISSKLKMDDVVGKKIDEVRKLAEENSTETFELDKVTARVKTDSSGNNTTKELISILDNDEQHHFIYDSLTSGQIRDKYYAGYVEVHRGGVNAPDVLITEVSKGDVINFDKADGKNIKEDK